MNEYVIDWFDAHLTPEEVRGKRILDVGSRDVNGSLRPLLLSKGAGEYLGLDLVAGAGVDVVCDVCAAVECLGAGGFDLIVSACALEHVENLQRAASQMKRLCVPGGLLLVAAPSKWRRHDYPGDYWRFTLAGLCVLFGDCEALQVAEVTQSDARANVFGKFRKPLDWKEQPGILTLGI